MTEKHLPSPYLAPGFYQRALAEGRHRAIVGGRWEETGRLQMTALRDAGLGPEDHLLDIGAGALRLGRLAAPFLLPGRYWATDASAALMARGRAVELDDPSRLPRSRLVEDAAFRYPDVPAEIDMAIAFAVFTHLPDGSLLRALWRARMRFPRLRAFLFTVFLAPDGPGALRQKDGVVTHPDRPPYHLAAARVERIGRKAGFAAEMSGMVLPRGQRLFVARPTGQPRS